MMLITGELKIHKRTATRKAAGVVKDNNGDLAVYDTLPDNYELRGGQLFRPENDKLIEPDIIVRSEGFSRIEREGHHWQKTRAQSLRKRAKERDDVDEDEIPDNL